LFLHGPIKAVSKEVPMIILVLNATGRRVIPFLLLAAAVMSAPAAFAQENLSAKSKEVYEQVKAFSLTGGSAEATGLVLKRDRAEMTFDGTFYFASPVEGRETGAVFKGKRAYCDAFYL
jgi:hypothetical protein